MTFPESSRERRDLLIEALCLTRELDRFEDELDVFRSRDLPAFETWFTARFRREREEIRELERELGRLTDRHNAVVALAKMHDLSMERAFRMVAKEDRTLTGANEATRLKIEDDRRRRRSFLAAEMEREFRMRTGSATEGAASVRAPVDIDVDQLKSTYRKLARRLHPDVDLDGADTAELRWRRKYWTLLQEARTIGDAFALTDLDLATRVRQLDLVDIDVVAATRARDWFKRERDVRAVEFARARDSVAWLFTTTPEADVDRRVRHELALDAQAVRDEMRELHEEHEYLKLLARGARRGDDKTSRRRARAPRASAAMVQQLSFFD